MALRVCLVTPFAWSRPHDVNEHVAGVAHELRELGHGVTVLAPSTRAASYSSNGIDSTNCRIRKIPKASAMNGTVRAQ